MTSKPNYSKYITGLLTGILVTLLLLNLTPQLLIRVKTSSLRIPFFPYPTPTLTTEQLQNRITKEVLPEKVNLGVSFNDTIIKMVEEGAIDKEKFLALYENRRNLFQKEKSLLDKPSSEKIVITKDNADILLNLLWPLGLSNKTKVLSEGPMGTEYKDTVGNFASTGGWPLGRQDGGKLFNRFDLISLTPDQEQTVKEIAENIYRPCCGNSTYFPDCNHGAAMLGFIELAVSQGMLKEEIYKKALALNSYWFPQTYVEDALYFQVKKGISWDKVDPKEVLGATYSSRSGYVAINQELQSIGIIPKVEGGGSCGV
ncbi:hypothetical protein HYW54_00040 [Candidatus Gottesmanbacteria bacterium]|nr:hypothetical protein [Candidatus Gottesmanbacteria bacterium]